jgi:hypothetical protein
LTLISCTTEIESILSMISVKHADVTHVDPISYTSNPIFFKSCFHGDCAILESSKAIICKKRKIYDDNNTKEHFELTRPLISCKTEIESILFMISEKNANVTHVDPISYTSNPIFFKSCFHGVCATLDSFKA